MNKNKSLSIPPDGCLQSTNVSVHVFIEDEAYLLLNNVLKLYSNENLDTDSIYFNKQLSRARKTMGCAFNILYSKWWLFLGAIKPLKEQLTTVKATCLLQNVITGKEGMKHHLKATTYYPADVSVLPAQHTW
jgi:hypothetical protein